MRIQLAGFEVRAVDNLKRVLRYSWTIRFLALAVLLETAQGSVAFFAGSDLFTAPQLSAINMGLALAALVARCVAQDKVNGTSRNADTAGGAA